MNFSKSAISKLQLANNLLRFSVVPRISSPTLGVGFVARQFNLNRTSFSTFTSLRNENKPDSDPKSADPKQKHKPSLSDANYENIEFAVHRDLNQPKSNKKKFLAFLLISIATWAIGIDIAVNYGKRASSSVTAALFMARMNEKVRAELGSDVDLPGLFSRIPGEVNNVSGIIDVVIPIMGSKNIKAALHLKSHRSNKKTNTWETDEFYVQLSDGTKIELNL
ncbi:hypothetical protein BB560_003240 [Smittium megazygosporum]|uniref:Cytochrome oxidase assembly protein 1 n=1 Tax=Smittium megazygosporum TaxID=133381 RepID=A0A2T9ZCI7_9FUNG|nr:hypothetical protein BB560_003240 [Smittium megazygosporum]